MNREVALNQWLKQTLKSEAYQIIQISGDASFRRYFRVSLSPSSYIVMDAPPPEAPKLFMDIAEILNSAGLKVPCVLASNLKEGFLLLSDFGDRLYLNELTEDSADALYGDALHALIQMQKITAEVPLFDIKYLKAQLELFYEWYIARHLKLKNIESLRNTLDPIFDTILGVIDEQPRTFVHRDYHSRNLMILETKSPGILDFQDAVLGPITYDLVSLFQDCYISWPRNTILRWLEDYKIEAKSAQLLTGKESDEAFLYWFDWTGLQRHIKNLGIFTRLHYRDGKSQYLKDIAMPLKYISETCQRYSELQPLAAVFRDLNLQETLVCVP